MEKLIAGIVEFREHQLPKYAQRFRDLALAQTPDTLMITCSDSRVVPDLLVSTHPGDLFTMRNVGNLMPPATAEGVSVGDVSEASALEYAVLVLKVANIVVCGHSQCGAMKAALARGAMSDTPNLEKWLHHASTAAVRLAQEGPLDPSLPRHDQLSQLNVLVQIEHLLSYPIVRTQVLAGALQISGWWFDIATGDMYAFERETRSFKIIDREVAERLTGRQRPA